MSADLIEAIPNLSAGADREIVSQLEAATTKAPAGPGRAVLLDVHTDNDHNRSVFTIAGDRNGLLEALINMSRAATERIDLRTHEGAHPRMGAVDVAPFVAIAGDPNGNAADLAHEFAEAVWAELRLPSYFYGAADQTKRTLPEVRVPFERLPAHMAKCPPDVGDPEPHPSAGAIAVGVREAMVAFNVLLESNDVDLARQIASELRELNGGLAGVRALGLYMESLDLAQVSMNLTEPALVGVGEAFGAVRSAAGRRGVAVRGGELVGLAPRVALAGCTAEVLAACQIGEDRVLENRLDQVGLM